MFFRMISSTYVDVEKDLRKQGKVKKKQIVSWEVSLLINWRSVRQCTAYYTGPTHTKYLYLLEKVVINYTYTQIYNVTKSFLEKRIHTFKIWNNKFYFIQILAN